MTSPLVQQPARCPHDCGLGHLQLTCHLTVSSACEPSRTTPPPRARARPPGTSDWQLRRIDTPHRSDPHRSDTRACRFPLSPRRRASRTLFGSGRSPIERGCQFQPRKRARVAERGGARGATRSGSLIRPDTPPLACPPRRRGRARGGGGGPRRPAHGGAHRANPPSAGCGRASAHTIRGCRPLRPPPGTTGPRVRPARAREYSRPAAFGLSRGPGPAAEPAPGSGPRRRGPG